jgi:serine/threonine-protein kinase
VIGETLGNYRIVSTIGEGGMGVVYRGEHVLIGRKVAIKLLQPKMSDDLELVDRFFNEARTAAMIQHPGIAEVFDFGYREDGRAFIVMELLEGESLTARLVRDHKLSLDIALAIARQVASALHAAHELGIVHRDLKPENIFLIPDRSAPGHVRTKVLDFGIAKLARNEEQRSVKTRTGAVFGTPRYMSPEQCKNATSVDRRSDIYALGCIIYEMVLGTPPFSYDSWGELVAAHIHETPPRPRELDRELRAEVEALLLRTLAKPAADRFATMAALAEALEECWHNVSVTGSQSAALFTPPAGIHTVAPRETPMPPQVAPTLVAAELTTPPAPRSRRWLAFAIAGTVIGGVIGTILIANRSEDDGVAHVVAPPSKGPPMLDAAGVMAPAMPPPPPVADAAVPVVTRVRLVVDSLPHGAEVYRALDGVRLGKTPLTRDLERTDGEIEFVLKLVGYRDARVTMPTAKDGTTTTTLSRMPASPPPPPPPVRDKPNTTILDPYGGT